MPELPPMQIGGLRGRQVPPVTTPETRKSEGEGGLSDLAPIPEHWQEPVTWEPLQAAWHRFADQREADGRGSLALTLRNGKLLLESPGAVAFEVINSVQTDQLDNVRTQLLDFLRRELRHATLELDVRIAVDRPAQETVKFLTERERYSVWAEKYPAMEQLRVALDLDLA